MKLIALTATALGAALAITATTATGFALTASTDTVVTATVKNHPDAGHGTPDIWARDSFKLTTTIHQTSPGHYTLTTVDHGTFTANPCATCSPNAGVAITHKVTGSFDGTGTGTADGTLKSATDIAALNGKTIDDTAAVDQASGKFHSSTWFQQFFEQGVTGGAFSTHYAFTYKTVDQTYGQTTENDTKDNPTAGDITGKLSSRLVAANKCRVRGSNTNRWTVKNVAGDRSRTFIYRVSYHKAWSGKATATVAAGGTTTITTATGGYLSVLYWDGYGAGKYISARSAYRTVC